MSTAQTPTSSADIMARFVRFMAVDSPALNCACRDGELSLGEWLAVVAPVVREVSTIAHQVTPDGAELLLRGGGMLVLASERLAQPTGLAPGAILQHLPGLSEMLVLLAGPDARPALTHKGYWLRNLPPLQFTFTNSSHEKFFIEAVQSQTTMRQSVHDLLLPIRTWAVRPDSSIASRMVTSATAVLEQGQLQYRDFHRGPDGEPGQTPAEFNEMRVWLSRTKISGTVYGGPNAAYIVQMAGTDFDLGTDDEHYQQYVQGFFAELDAEERRFLQRCVETPSLIDALSTAMGYSDTHAMSAAATDEVAARLSASPNLLATAAAAKALYKAFCGGSGAHVGLISTHLVKHGLAMTPEERALLPVDPGEGVGGHGHDHTRHLHDTRRASAGWKALADAVARHSASLTSGHEGVAA
jgi:hypothetical protein